MTIIGIHGSAGSGKTTVSEIFSKHYPRCFTIPFAQKIKNVAKELGWNGIKDDKGRALLQSLGETLYQYDPQALCKFWSDSVNFIFEKHEFDSTITILSDDVRRIEEIETIRKRGGFCIKIKGRSKYKKSSIFAKHTTEKEISDKHFSYVIDNSGSKKDLESKVKNIITKEKK